MTQLEQLQPNAALRGILPDSLVTVVSVQWFGSEALELTYKGPDGKVANLLLYRDDEPRLEVVEQGRPWSFDGDGALFRLVSEAHRIRLAHLFDPVLAVHTSDVEPLPHQITGVYEAMLPRQPLRFLLADDPGAGKRQALPMVWDYVETNPFAGAGGDIYGTVRSLTEVLDNLASATNARSEQQDAQVQPLSRGRAVSTDPPYYDNVGYADLSDFFYVWLRRSLKPVYPDLFATLAVPKDAELVATPYRHGTKEKAEAFFLNGMTLAIHQLATQAHPGFPITIYYAFKQSETGSSGGTTTSTGWETFLDAVMRAGLTIGSTWPMRSELATRNIGRGANALASSIVLVCRRRAADAKTATRREFLTALKAELPKALAHLQRGNIAPVDLAQAAIGPGMAVYTRYARVLDAEGNPVPVREALALINQTLDEVLAEQEGDFDADSRWALAWFEQCGFAEGEYGVAETLSKAKNTSVAGLAEAGILAARAGKVRLFRPAELPSDWDPATDRRLTVWETVHQLIRALESGGEGAAAALVAKLGSRAEAARELAYRLYTICERKKRAAEALSYNSLVQSWPEITRLARAAAQPPTEVQLPLGAP